jgi:hypothetical protein
MTERIKQDGELPERETAEQMGMRLIELVDKAEFGTPEFQAVSDYLLLEELLTSLNSPDREAGSESDPPVLEIRVALHQNQIEYNKSNIRGYAFGFREIERAVDDLISATIFESEQKHGDKKDQDAYISEVGNVAMDAVREIVDEKRHSS